MQKLTQLTALEGKTIRGAYDSRDGRDLVLVFNDDDWCVLTIENEMSEDESVGIDYVGFGEYAQDVKNYLSPEDLLEARLLSQAQYDYLVDKQRKEKAEYLRQEAERLISQANKLSEATA